VYPVAFAGFVVIHELGHVVAAGLVGVPSRVVVIGPFALLRGVRGWRLRRTRTGYHHGYVWARRTDRPPRWWQGIALAAGGPAASAIAAGLGVLLVGRGLDATDALDAGRVAAVTGGGVVVLLGVSDVLLTALGRSGDGKLIVDFWRTRRTDAPDIDRVRFRDLTDAMIADPRTGEPRPMLAYYRALDRGDRGTAMASRRRFVDALTEHPPADRGGVWAEAAYGAAFLERDVVAARENLEASNRLGVISPTLAARARAAVLLIEGDLEGARSVAEHGLCSYGVDPRDTPVERGWLEAIRSAAESSPMSRTWGLRVPHAGAEGEDGLRIGKPVDNDAGGGLQDARSGVAKRSDALGGDEAARTP
jgi:hypothetical protein